MGCCLSFLELQFLQAEYMRVPDEIYDVIPTHDLPPPLPKLMRSTSCEIGPLSQGNFGDFSRKYGFLEELGHGSYSIVKLGLEIVSYQFLRLLILNQGTDHRVAVKIVNKAKLGTGLNLMSLFSEITTLSQCDHENIIKLHNVYDESPNYYLVTEYVPGGELFDCIIRRTYFTESCARKMIVQILKAVHYLHTEVGIVHRDIKPDNILVTTNDGNGIIKLADFGFAKHISKLTANEISLGTPAYVAPEIIRGDPYGAEVDIWSLGVVCYIMLCGCPPFQGESSKIFDQIKAGSYDFHEEQWSRVSPLAVDMVSRMLTVNQQERWTTEQLLIHPWITSSNTSPFPPSLDICLSHLKRFTARKKLKAVAQVVIVANRMKKFACQSSNGEAIRRYQRKQSVDQMNLPKIGA